MQAVVVGQDLTAEVRPGLGELVKGWDRGRYWSIPTYYLYTLLWDPFVLARTQSAPLLRAPGESITDGAAVFFTQSATAADAPLIADVLRRDGHAVLPHPAPELLEAGGFELVDAKRPMLISLRERWNLGRTSSRAYYYPDQQKFLRLAPRGGRVLSRIGGNPDLIVSKRAAVWAGNACEAVAHYTTMPGVLSQLLGELGGLVAQIVGEFTDHPLDEADFQRLIETIEIRRDFHALGYAHLTVLELARCFDRDVKGVGEVESIALEAADFLIDGQLDAAEGSLSRAFKELERINRPLQPKPAIFIDSLHGGTLFPDIGYFEIEWPQHPADTLRTFLRWAQTRSYRFNVDFGATTVREMALRFPDLFTELKAAQNQQMVEFVNGSCNQPYPPLHSLESQIRQFDVGVQVWQNVFGSPPRTYASQEFGFCPQIAAVLAQQSYQQAVVRVQNMGDAPTFADEQIEWIAPNGDHLRSLPSHPHKSEQLNSFTYNNLHLKLYLHQRQTPDFAVFTCLGDITYHRHMREELIRTCHYASVFGRFSTLAAYFDSKRNETAPERRLEMRDFNCDAGFLNLELWGTYAGITGYYNTHCTRSHAATNLFAAAELVDAVATLRGAQPLPEADHDKHWEALAHYQGHDNYLAPSYPSGAFLGGINAPGMSEAGRGVPIVAEYVGPFSPRLVKDVMGALMSESERQASSLIQQRLLAMPEGGNSDFVLYNFAPRRQQLVTLPGLAGRTITVGGATLLAQDDQNDRLVLIDLPSYGCAFIVAGVAAGSTSPSVIDPVSVGENHLDNSALRAEFDLQTGTIQRLLCKASGHELLASLRSDDARSGGFYCPGSGAARCRAVRRVANGPLRGAIEFDLEMPVQNQDPCLLRTRVSLDTQQAELNFETRVLKAPHVKGNQWRNHLAVRFVLADRDVSIETCHFNVLERHDGEQLISPNVIVARSQATSVAMFNEGNQFYRREGNLISNILIVENESARCFRYGIGIAADNPIMQARMWAQPVTIAATSSRVNISADAPVPAESYVISFVSLDSADVEVLSARVEEGTLRVRLANTTGRPIEARLKTFLAFDFAERTGLDGRRPVPQEVCDGQIMLSLRPWDIVQTKLATLSVSASSGPIGAGKA
jgi:hypothetical protein